jgi:hypothetical protein
VQQRVTKKKKVDLIATEFKIQLNVEDENVFNIVFEAKIDRAFVVVLTTLPACVVFLINLHHFFLLLHVKYYKDDTALDQCDEKR